MGLHEPRESTNHQSSSILFYFLCCSNLQFEHNFELPSKAEENRFILGHTNRRAGSVNKGGVTEPCQGHSEGETQHGGEQPHPENPG